MRMRRVRVSGFELPLRYKLALAFSVLMSSAAIFLYVYVPGRLQKQGLEGLQDKAHAIARITAYTAAPGVLFSDTIGLREAMTAAGVDPDVMYISISNALGAVIGSYGHQRDDTNTVTQDEEIAHVGQRVGSVRVLLSSKRLDETIASMKARIALTTFLLFAATVVLAFAIATLVTRPLAVMTAAAARIARGGALTKVTVGTRDEVGRLAATFNVMIERLQSAQEQLLQANAGLEDRVLERTSALEQEMMERRRSDDQLEASEQRFRAVFESAGVGIAVLDTTSCVVNENHALTAMMNGADIRDLSFIDFLDPPSRHRFSDDCRVVLAEPGASVQSELMVQPPDSGVVPVVCTLSAVADATGLYLIMLLKDISEQRAMEERYRQSQKLEGIGRLAGGIAHDFNNLLTTINGVTELLLERATGTDRTDLEDVQRAGHRAAELTKQLLAFSRRQMLRPEVVQLNDIVTETTRMLRRIVGADITIALRLDPEAACILADSSQMVQVIMNLVVNAKDALASGGNVAITTSMTRAGPEMAAALDLAGAGGYVKLEIVDDGSGMSDAVLDHAFEPFFTTKELGKGTGLGLATVYGIVRQSGGAITVQSAPGKGTTFTILLPAVDHAAHAVAVPSVPRLLGKRTETILLVDDDNAVRAFVSRVLVRRGFNVLQAGNGADACALLDGYSQPIDLLLTDVVMPRMGGPELADAMRREHPRLQVIFMSGYTPDDLSERLVFGERAHFIQKPMSADSLLCLVDDILALSQVGD